MQGERSMRLWRLALTCGETRILFNRGFYQTFFTQRLKKPGS
jgi:hypothetical protein